MITRRERSVKVKKTARRLQKNRLVSDTGIGNLRQDTPVIRAEITIPFGEHRGLLEAAHNHR